MVQLYYNLNYYYFTMFFYTIDTSKCLNLLKSVLKSKYSENKIRLIHVINDVKSFKYLFDPGLKKFFCPNVAGLRRKLVIPSHDF